MSNAHIHAPHVDNMRVAHVHLDPIIVENPLDLLFRGQSHFATYEQGYSE